MSGEYLLSVLREWQMKALKLSCDMVTEGSRQGR